MNKTWTLELDHDETIALARAIWGHIEELGREPWTSESLTTVANLQKIIVKFVDEDEFLRITPQIIEEKRP